jgi:hypothetical protein
VTSRQPSRILGICLFVACAVLYASPNLDAAGANTPASPPQAAGKAPKACNPRRGPCPDPTVLKVQEARLDPPTVHALGVQVLIAGDANRNAAIGVRYREYGAVQWRQGPPLMRVFPENLSVAVPEQFAGSIFDLVPATTYEIELSALDSDGPVAERLVLTATTRAIPRTDPATPRLAPCRTAPRSGRRSAPRGPGM